MCAKGFTLIHKTYRIIAAGRDRFTSGKDYNSFSRYFDKEPLF